MFRVGFGQDSHRFSEDENKKLFLGGVEVKGERGLEGNSDGDLIIHSICAAIEQALGRENFSVYADEMCKNKIFGSVEYLKVARAHLKESGYIINNLGISLEGKHPKILPIENQIKNSLAQILEVNKNQIGINATTGDGLTSFGKGEGLQCFAILSLVKNEKN